MMMMIIIIIIIIITELLNLIRETPNSILGMETEYRGLVSS